MKPIISLENWAYFRKNYNFKDTIGGFANKLLFLGVGFFRSGPLFLSRVPCWALWWCSNKNHSAESVQESAKFTSGVMALRLFRVHQEWIVLLRERWKTSLGAPGCAAASAELAQQLGRGKAAMRENRPIVSLLLITFLVQWVKKDKSLRSFAVVIL